MSSETLAAVADIVMGQSPPGDMVFAKPTGLPLLNGPTEFGLFNPTPVQFTPSYKKVARRGDILFCVRGSTTGRMNNADQDYAIGRGLAAIRHKSDLRLQPLLRAVLESYLPELLARATGSTFPNVSASQLANVPFPSFDKTEQLDISVILGTLDDKIELNRQMNHTLEQMAQALFQSWFVDFDPVWAKKEGRQPVGMNADTAALFPDEFEESELGLIPKGWRVVTIGDVVTVYGGSTPSTKRPDYWNGDIAWVTPRDLSKLNSPILWETKRKITELGLKQIGSGLLPIGSVLLSSRAPIGYLAISKVPTAINQGFIGMVCGPMVSAYFILIWLRNNIDLIVGRANGTTFPEISKVNFRSIAVLLPPVDIMESFTRIVAPMYEMISLHQVQNRTLSSLRDTLLPKLLSGELRVPFTAEDVLTQEVTPHGA